MLLRQCCDSVVPLLVGVSIHHALHIGARQGRRDPKLWELSRQIVGSAGGMYTGNWVLQAVAVRKVAVKNIQILKKTPLWFP